MLKKIIKRDGSEQDFIPSKINGWGEWASRELEGRVDWSSVVLHVVSTLPEKASSQQLHEAMIRYCADQGTWGYNRMAGKLYSAMTNKKIHGDVLPSVQVLQQRLHDIGFMPMLAYSDEEYSYIESLINHRLDQQATYFELKQVREKYSIVNRVKGDEYESQQYVYMRMAMSLAEDQPKERRMEDLTEWYKLLSEKKLNAPTPNYTNLGTYERGLSSCCLYKSGDDAFSLAIGDHIAYIMTVMSAGIGNNIDTRGIGDPIRGGTIKHKGKLPYYRAMTGAVKANTKNGRNGALTTYYQAFDPEAGAINVMRNPKTPTEKANPDIDYALLTNKFFARKAAKNEDIFCFTSFNAPELYQAFYNGDDKNFTKIYEKLEADASFKKVYVSARELIIQAMNQAFETGRHYLAWADEMNRHTPFKETIWSSNLCTEIMVPTTPYVDMRDLYSTEDHGRGEIGMCTLGGAIVSNITSEEEYAKVAYYGLLMIDKCIHRAEYKLPHVGITAKARMNAGLGITGLAHYMAKKGQRYDTYFGKHELHRVAERHAFHTISASLRLGKELGNAPWMHKTKWPEGWLPIDTYNKNVDKISDFKNAYDWELLRAQIIANGGIRNSSLIAHMPTESSSKASGTTNCLYPARALKMMKTDEANVLDWCAPDNDLIGDQYQLAWDVPMKDMIECYAIFQKWTDQGISADLYSLLTEAHAKVSTSELLEAYILMTKFGMKSRYYHNSKTSDGTNMDLEVASETAGCGAGGCTL